MEHPNYFQVLNLIRNKPKGRLERLKITILRNITLEPLYDTYLQYHARTAGFDAEIRYGEYNNILQDVLGNPNSLLSEDTDLIIVFLHLNNLSPNLSRRFNGLNGEQIGGEIDRSKSFIDDLLSGIRSRSNAVILWYSLDLPAHPSLGIADHRSPYSQWETIVQLNSYLRQATAAIDSAYYVETNLVLTRLGAEKFNDPRFWHTGRAPYSHEACRELSWEALKYIRALKGKAKKCLVLDCDNVLWGGIVGEDDLAGIQLGPNHPGSCFYEFQEELLNLYHRGVLLSLCSKNDASLVWKVFRSHPHMILKEQHIAAAQVNWDDKATNIRRIAAELNIATDSMVFIDDSPHEIELIKSLLPEVATILVDPLRAYTYRDLLLSCGWFDTLSITNEDKARNETYQANKERQRLVETHPDIDDYLRSLEMKVEIGLADEFDIPRIAQLSQRTNQFNLTTIRYTDDQIRSLTRSDQADILTLKLSDRFGDLGLVGLCILKYQAENAFIDTLMLSCRALGRGVEDLLLTCALQRARHQGCAFAIGRYAATEKNNQVKEFYIKRGFDLIAQDESGYTARYRIDGLISDRSNLFKEIHFSSLFPMQEEAERA